MAEIALANVTKRFVDGTVAVDDLNLTIEDGEFMVLVGPSGCGKTTALRMIAGLETISEGEIRIGEKVVNDAQPRERDVAMVFQNYALYPHLTVYGNMAFALQLAKTDKDEIDRRVRDAARILGLEEMLERKPRALSGGQRQRVAMGRAIVRKPQAFLMDEPLSNLDAKLRVQMRSEIARIQDDLHVTTVYVTHDQIEAMTMGDRVAIMRKGELQQVGSPPELFAHPRNLFVAGFIGSPAMNLASARLEQDGGKPTLRFGEHRLLLGEKALERRPALRGYQGHDVIIGLRPQDFEDASLVERREGCQIKTHIDLVEAIGTETLVHFDSKAELAQTEEVRELQEDVAGEGTDSIGGEGNEWVAQLDPKTKVRRGEDVELAVDVDQIHFFDPETSLGIYDKGRDEAVRRDEAIDAERQSVEAGS